jgi:hypothetical protein
MLPNLLQKLLRECSFWEENSLKKIKISIMLPNYCRSCFGECSFEKINKDRQTSAAEPTTAVV